MPDEMKTNLAAYLQKMLGRWTSQEAQVPLGEPTRHRFGYDQQKNITTDIFAYLDPTRGFRELELAFDVQTKRLVNVYIYPWMMTWDDCKKLWGENVNVVRRADGTKFYVYKDRRINVYSSKDNHVINLGLY
jgi:hypothetical protein